MKKVMLTIATYLVAEKIAKEDFDVMDGEAKAEIFNAIQKHNVEVGNELTKAVEKGELTAKELAEQLAISSKENSQMQLQIMSIIKEIGVEVRSLMEGGRNTNEVKTLPIELKDKKEELKGLSLGTQKEVEIKAITNVAVVQDNQTNTMVGGISPLNSPTLTAEMLFNHVPVSGENVNKGVFYMDWDDSSIVRGASSIAESGVYPESGVKFIRRVAQIEKIGDSLPVTQEFYEDESMFAPELERFLRTNMEIVANEQIINGDGTNNSLVGINNRALLYTPTSKGIPSANVADLCHVMRTQMRKLGQKFIPDFVIMNSELASSIELEKDSNNNYLRIPYVSPNGDVIKGMNVVIDEAQADNTLVIGDKRYGTIYERTGLTLEVDRVGNQFLTDETTLKVRRRLFFLIKESDRAGFLKCTDVATALTTIAS